MGRESCLFVAAFRPGPGFHTFLTIRGRCRGRERPRHMPPGAARRTPRPLGTGSRRPPPRRPARAPRGQAGPALPLLLPLAATPTRSPSPAEGQAAAPRPASAPAAEVRGSPRRGRRRAEARAAAAASGLLRRRRGTGLPRRGGAPRLPAEGPRWPRRGRPQAAEGDPSVPPCASSGAGGARPRLALGRGAARAEAAPLRADLRGRGRRGAARRGLPAPSVTAVKRK